MAKDIGGTLPLPCLQEVLLEEFNLRAGVDRMVYATLDINVPLLHRP